MKKVFVAVMLLAAIGLAGWLVYEKIQPNTPRYSPPVSEAPKKQPPTHIDTVLAGMSLHEKIASLFIANTPGTDPSMLRQFVDMYKLGGFILMGENIPVSDSALMAETTAIKGDDTALPRLVAVDQEGGTVRRLKGDAYADARTLKNLPVSATTQAFAARSAMVHSVGITLNFGIIADTTADPQSFIYNRVLGTTPMQAAERVAAAVQATQGQTLSTLKHFPGHGETRADSHTSIPTTPVTYNQWIQRDQPPFKAGIDAGADVVMVGHLRYAAVDSQPASLSKKWHDILQNTLGFKGVVITDAMGMLQNSGESAYSDPVQNAVAAVRAGNTMLLYVFDDTNRLDPNVLIDGVMSAVQSGKIDSKQIDQNARKVLELRAKTASFAN